MPRIIAVSNQKGGVGKTTTTVNLAAALAAQGYRTLLIDLDPQGNATANLGFVRDDQSVGSYELLVQGAQLADVITGTHRDGLDLVAATANMVAAEVELTRSDFRETRLRGAFIGLDGTYDFILMDCPPSLGFVTINALVAAHSVLIPVQAEYLALEGLGQLLRTLSQVRKALNPKLAREGELLTLYDGRNRLCREVETQLRDVFGDEVFSTVIPRNVRLGEAPSYGQTIFDYAPGCLGAQAYMDLASEVLERLAMPARARQEAS